MPSAYPYLNFPGTCLEAFEFYRSTLGGEFGGVHKFSEMPSDAAPATCTWTVTPLMTASACSGS